MKRIWATIFLVGMTTLVFQLEGLRKLHNKAMALQTNHGAAGIGGQKTAAIGYQVFKPGIKK